MVSGTLAKLLIAFGIDTSALKAGAAEAGSAVEQVATSAKGTASSFGGSMQQMEKSIANTSLTGKIAAGAMSVATGLLAFQGVQMGISFISGIKTAVEQEDKLRKQTDAVIASTKSAANVTADWVDTYAKQLQGTTGINEDVVKSSENMLLTFTSIQNRVGAGNDIFNQATMAVMNMSTALGEDATSASIQLGKALNDPIKGITALHRVGVAFTDQQKAQIKTMVESGNTMGAQKIILGELTTEFGNSAVAFGNSAAGIDAKFQNAMSDLQRGLGAVLLPVLNAVLGAITFVVTHSEVLIPILAAIGAVILMEVVPALATMVITMTPINLVILAVAAGVAALAWAFQTNFMGIGDIVRAVAGVIKSVFDVIVGIVRGVIDFVLSAANAIVGIAAAIPGPWQQGAQDVQKSIDQMKAGVDTWGQSAPGDAADAGFAVGSGMASGVANGIDDGAPAVAAAQKTMIEQFGTTMSAVKQAAAVGGASAMYEMAKGIDAARKSPLDAFDTLKKMLKDSLSPLAEAMKLGGQLASKTLAQGLADGRPDVRAQALGVVQDTVDQLVELTGEGGKAGAKAMAELAAGIKSKNASIRNATQTALAETYTQYQALVVAGGPQGVAAMAALDAGIRSKIPAIHNAALAAKNAAISQLNTAAAGAGTAGTSAGEAFASGLTAAAKAGYASLAALERSHASAPSASGGITYYSHATGSWNLPADELAFLHAGEMVVPPQTAAKVRAGEMGLGAGPSTGGGVHIGNLTIHNPSPEPAGRSAETALRRLAMMGQVG